MGFRIAILFGALITIMVAIGFAIGGYLGGLGGAMFFGTAAFALALVINFVSYWYSAGIVLKIYRAKPTNDKELNEMVDDLALNAKIPKPKVYVISKDVPNAFATGRSKKKGIICVTEGLLTLSKDEIKGVLGHEIAHIANNDILIQTVAAIVAGTVSYLAQIGYWSMFFSGGQRRDSGSLIGLLLVIIFAPLAALLIKLAISRTREYNADYYGARFSKNPGALASALKKISEIARNSPIKGSVSTENLWIVNPFKRDWFVSLFSTHPPIARRIKRLDDMSHEGMPEPREATEISIDD